MSEATGEIGSGGALSRPLTKEREAHGGGGSGGAPAPEVHRLVCRHCGRDAVTRSHRRPWERPLGWIGILPYRCLDCWGRFYH